MKKIAALLLLLNPSISMYPQSTEPVKNNIYYQRYASAETMLHDYLKQRPSDAEAWLLLTKCYLLQGEPKKAADSLALSPAGLNEQPNFLVAKGGISLTNGKTDSARQYFEKAIDITRGKSPDILAAIAEMESLANNGDFQYALDLVIKARKRDKSNAELDVIEGNIYRKMMDGGQAFRAYKNAIEKNASLAAAHYYLGEIFLSQKNPDLYLSHFQKAIEADKNYGPAYYQLYRHYVYTNPDAAKAMEYFKQYASQSDQAVQSDYSYTDLLYLNKSYPEAIGQAKELMIREGDKVQPRLYKLVAYSYAESKDTVNATAYMSRYFRHENDTNFIAKDFETMAQLYESDANATDSALVYYQKAIGATSDSAVIYQNYRQMASLAGAKKDFDSQSKWLGHYYLGNEKASNVDLFNWGIAAYRSGNFLLADSVFGLYTTKYPEQGFGYYWRARTNAVIDSGMVAGLAIPYYNKLIETIHGDSLSATDKKWKVEAYAYIASYEANTLKDYDKAIEYFGKILEIDPENASARKYIPILEASAKKKEGSN